MSPTRSSSTLPSHHAARDALMGPWLCGLAMVLVGSTVVVSRLIGDAIEPFLATALRHAAALPVFLLMMFARREAWPRVGWRDGALLLVQAAAGSVGYTVLLIEGVQRCGPADAGIVAGTLPAVSALVCAGWLGERPGWRLWAAIALATVGVLAVAASPAAGEAAPLRWLGIALVLAAIGCESLFILANKRLSMPISPLALSTLMSAGGLLLCLVPAAWAWGSSPTVWTADAVSAVLYYAWVPTVGGFLLWYAGSARTTGTRASLATAWLPVSALMLSALWFGEPIRAVQWMGLGCVLAAVVLAALDSHAA
ncbi:DMT family transporter [Ideonella sp. DXS29W]|uniref:DMT family transporter n=1 Tax=Ideonella lacteola TaxID=2984193 RepID=A0ABU9BYD5_9BURK